MSWDRRCIECGGWLTDRAGGLRQCVGCSLQYRFAGGMLTPAGAPRAPGHSPETDPAEGAATRFGESPSGTFGDPRRRGRQGQSLYENEVPYSQLFREGPPDTARVVAERLLAEGRGSAAAACLLEDVEVELERELFYPDQEHDATGYLELLDQAMAQLGRAEAKACRDELTLKQRRFQRARERLDQDPDRLLPFRAAVGRDMGRFLGDRRSGFGDLPEERRLPLEGGSYRLLPPGAIQVGPPGGPRRSVRLDAFHMRTRLVSNGDYATFLEKTGYPPHPLWGWRGLDLPNHPVVGVSWEDAAAYAAHHGGRLPTEAEWCAAYYEDEAGFLHHADTWELMLDDAGDPGGPMGTQGVVLLGTGFPKAIRAGDARRGQLSWGGRRADVGFRLVLDPRMA